MANRAAGLAPEAPDETPQLRRIAILGLRLGGEALLRRCKAEQRVGRHAQCLSEAHERIRARQDMPTLEPAADLDGDPGSLRQIGLGPSPGSPHRPKLARKDR